MNCFSQKLHFHTRYWRVNVSAIKEINGLRFHIRYAAC